MKNIILILASSNVQVFGRFPNRLPGLERPGIRLPSAFQNANVKPPKRVNPFTSKTFNTGSEDDPNVHMKSGGQDQSQDNTYMGSFFDDFLLPQNDHLFENDNLGSFEDGVVVEDDEEESEDDFSEDGKIPRRCLQKPPLSIQKSKWVVKFYYHAPSNTCKHFKYRGEPTKGENKFTHKRKCEEICVQDSPEPLTEEPDQSEELIQNRPALPNDHPFASKSFSGLGRFGVGNERGMGGRQSSQTGSAEFETEDIANEVDFLGNDEAQSSTGYNDAEDHSISLKTISNEQRKNRTPFTGPKSCNEPKGDPGLCRGFFRHFTYDKASNSCVEFVWGGCHGGMDFMLSGRVPEEGRDYFNNFSSKSECEDVCVDN